MKFFRRLLCFVGIHDWIVLSDSCHRVVWHAHLHAMAGCAAVCGKCWMLLDYRCDKCRERGHDLFMPEDAR